MGPTGRVATVWAAALLAAGCAGALVSIDGGFRHSAHGYRIDAPDGSGAPWQRVDLEGAALAFRRPGPQSLSLVSRCGRPVAAPALMARHLVIGVRNRTLVGAGPIPIGDESGWFQTFDTLSASGQSVRVKTVTLVARGCSFDWVLASGEDFAGAEAAFDAWWGSFRLEPAPAARGGS